MTDTTEAALRPFKDFERRGWREVAERYDAAFVGATGQAIGPMLDAVGAGPGVRLLDVACGPGYGAAAAAARGAGVLGVDFAAEMVALAQRKWPAVEFREGDAEILDLPAAGFDAVIMNFGVLHLANPDSAIAECFRVLRPGAGGAGGGRFAFTVWEPPPATVPFAIVLEAVERHGVPDIGVPPGPPMFRFSDPHEARRVLGAAGFEHVRFQTLPITLALADPDALFRIMLDAGVRTSGLLKAQTPAALDKIREHMRGRVAAYRIGDRADESHVMPMPAVLITATKPA
jgi:SAM-dependent methyltransferase